MSCHKMTIISKSVPVWSVFLNYIMCYYAVCIQYIKEHFTLMNKCAFHCLVRVFKLYNNVFVFYSIHTHIKHKYKGSRYIINDCYKSWLFFVMIILLFLIIINLCNGCYVLLIKKIVILFFSNILLLLLFHY